MAKKLRFLFTLLFVMAATLSWGEEKKATLTISKGLDISEKVYDDDGNIWTITTDHKAPSTSMGYIQAGTNSASVSYIKLISNSFIGKKVKKIQVWGTSKANTDVTTKISIGETLLGTSGIYTVQNASSGGTEFCVENTNNVDGVITILISRPEYKTGAIYFNKAIITYEEEGGTPVAVAAPTFTPEAGTYTGEQKVAISTTTVGATIYYTTDGTTPTNESTEYTAPLTVSETTTVKAIAYKDDESSTVSEATYIIKFDYVTLPFFWGGGAKSDLIAIDGVSATGLGTDYSDGTYKVKFDDTGDYILIKTDGQPGKVTIGVKMIGGASASSIKVQGSSDGEDFDDIETLSISGSQNKELNLSITSDFKSTHRYVKLVFTKGSNVGVGPIRIAKYVELKESGLNFTQGEVSAIRGQVFNAPTLNNPYNLPVSYSSSDESVATVDASTGDVTLVKAGETTITATFAGNDEYKAGSASYTLTVTVPSHTATFFVNGDQVGEPVSVAEDDAITFPEVSGVHGKSFVGWTTKAIEGTTNDKPELDALGTMGTADVTFYAVFAYKEGSAESKSINITAGTENVPSAYGTANTFAEYTLDGKKFQIMQMYKNGGKLQWRAAGNENGTGTMYNTDALDNIQSIVLSYDASDSNKNFTVKVGNTANPTNGTEVTPTISGANYTFNCTGNNNYFVLTNGSGAGYLTSLTINYMIGSVVYSDYCTTVVEPVAQVGNEKYETLQAAFDAAKTGETVTLLKDYDATKEAMAGGTRQFVIKKSITFDGGGFTLTTKERGIGVGNVNGDLSSNIDVTIKNVTINNTSSGARCIDTRGKIGSLTLEGVTLKTDGAPSGYTQPLTIGGNQSDAATVNITNSTIQTNDAGTAYYAIITFNPVNMTVTNSTIKGWANVYAKGVDSSAGSAGSTFTFDGCTLVSSNAYSGVSNAFGAFVMEDNNITINVTNSNVTLNNTGDQTQALVSNNNHTDNNVTFGEGNKIKFVEPGKFDFVSNPGENIKFTVSGGLFNVSVPENLCAEGMIPAANTDSETSTTYPYTVKVGSYVAQVGEQKFETFDEAVAAVTEENNVVTLLANVTEGYTITADKALNVNLNGFTLTVIAPEGYLLKTEVKDGVTTYSAIAPVAQIGDVKYETIAAAVAAAEEGQTVKVIKGGEYTLPGIAKNITIEGAEEIEVLFTHTAAGSIASIPNGATFKNVKFEFGNVNYHGFQHAGTINMEGCTLSGKLFSYGDMNFTNCQFVQTNSDYHMWTYSGNVTYTDCTFTNEKTGKFINVYNESGATKYTVTATNCEFINKEGNAANKAAINVKATCEEKLLVYDVIINKCTTEGAFPEASVTQPLAILNNLVQVDDRTEDGVDNITVTHDDVQIYPIRNYVAQVGETKYETLREALDAAKDNENIVVELLADADLDITAWDGEKNPLSIGSVNTKSITINGNNHTLTFNQKNSDWNNVATMKDAETKLILNNMAITNSGHNDGPWNRHDINFNCAVELNNVTSDKALAFKNDATLKNVTVTDTGDVYGIWISPRKEGQNISIDGLTLTAGRGIKIDDKYVDNPEKVTLDIKNATFNTTTKSAILVKSKAETAITVGEDVNIENVAADKVNTVWVDEDYADEFYKVAVEGATVVPESKEADYDACLMKGDQRWGFYKKVSSAIEKVEDGYGIKLFRTTTEAVSVVKTLTIVKNGFTADNVTAGEGFVRIETDTEIKIISTSAIPTTPVVFHDSGKYEAELSVPMYAQAGAKIYYTIGESTEAQEYSTPLTINKDTKITAWSELNGVKSAVVTREYTIVSKPTLPTVADGYYSIKNNGNGKFVNVAGRKTVTFVDDNSDKAGTVIKVKATDGKVEVLRSQGVDLPGYAKKAMNYVPEIVELVVNKLHAADSGEILGPNGFKKIMDKFNESFDYNLYLEKAGEGYRIYGKTPSMKPVVDFYAENKADVDFKLPQLEDFINRAIRKVLEKTNGHGASILTEFKLLDIWQKMGGTLTEPTDEATTAKFYEEVLSSEANVWNFAYQTAMKYWEPLIKHEKVQQNLDKLGDYAKYLEKVENIQPDFKYYIVGNTSGNGVDFISDGNIDIKNDAARTIWTLEPRADFKVTFNEENSINLGRELYTTLYTDFAYTVPEKVKAYKVTAIDEKTGLATKEEITGVIPAQTPVLLQMIVDPKTVTDADLTQTLTLSTEAGTAVTGNLLQGPDALINAFNIKTAQVVSLFEMAKEFLGESAYNTYVKEYEHLQMKNAGTVNNKYFFGIGTAEDTGNKIYSAGTTLRTLFKGDKKLGFYLPQDVVKANTAFILDETNPVLLSLVGDVTRDGKVNISDVTAQIDIILGKDTPEDNYDYDAADVDGNGVIKIKDVTDLIDIILGKNKTE